jgi:hypothetical protein
MKNIKLIANISTGSPVILYTPWKSWLYAITRGANIKAYKNGQYYWVNKWNAQKVKPA